MPLRSVPNLALWIMTGLSMNVAATVMQWNILEEQRKVHYWQDFEAACMNFSKINIHTKDVTGWNMLFT